MKKNLKRFGSLSILLFANSIYAGDMGPVSKGFDKDRAYVGGEAIYGDIGSGILNTPYASTFSDVAGTLPQQTVLPSGSNGWGFRVIAGYHLDSSSPHDIEASYLYLNRNAQSQANGAYIRTSGMLTSSPNTFSGTSSNNATAIESNYAQYQTLQINNITRQAWTWFPAVEHSYIYGVRGTYIKEGIAAYYSSGDLSNNNRMLYGNELYGLGPQVGTALKWNVMEHFQIGGDILGGLVFGNQRARYTDNGFVYTANTQRNYIQTQSNIFGSILLSGQIYAGFNYLDKNNQVIRIDGGVSADSYTNATPTNNFSGYNGSYKGYNNFLFRDVFVRLVYKA